MNIIARNTPEPEVYTVQKNRGWEIEFLPPTKQILLRIHDFVFLMSEDEYMKFRADTELTDVGVDL